jgi:hypothetical protein
MDMKLPLGIVPFVLGAKVVNTSKDTLQWLHESLRTTQAMAESNDKPGVALAEVKDRIARNEDEQWAKVQRLWETLKEWETQDANAANECRKAREAYDAARKDRPSSSSEARVREKRQQWHQAEAKHRAVIERLLTSIAGLHDEMGRWRGRVKDLEEHCTEVQRFAGTGTPEQLAKQCADFDRWIKVLEEDMRR